MQRYALNARPLDWYDYGARFYDPELARFHTLDPLTEYFPCQSPFVYANNNPVRYIDFLGLSAQEPDEPIDGGEIEPVYIVHTRPPAPSPAPTPWYQQAFGYIMNGFNRNLDHDSRLPRAQHTQYIGDITDMLGSGGGVRTKAFKAIRDVISAFWEISNIKNMLKIVGDDTGAIEATIDNKFKVQLEESNEPNKTSLKTNIATMFDYFNEDSTKIHRVINGDTINTAILNNNGTYYFE